MLTPTTELEAVNRMLRSIQEAPVATLVNSTNVDALDAQATLLETSRAVQSPGFHFNREFNVTLVTDVDGKVPLPTNTMSVDLSEYGGRMVQRGAYLYDREKHTFIIGAPVKVDITYLLAFDELPEPVRHYITVRAARQFQRQAIGSQTLEAFTQEAEQYARAAFLRYVELTEDNNMLNSPEGYAARFRRRGSYAN